MKTHNLKCWPEFFEKLMTGEKTFDIRLNDRDYQVGDTVKMREYNPDTREYTGRGMDFNIKYITKGLHGQLGVNTIVMQLEPAMVLGFQAGAEKKVDDVIKSLAQNKILRCNADITVSKDGERMNIDVNRVLEQL